MCFIFNFFFAERIDFNNIKAYIYFFNVIFGTIKLELPNSFCYGKNR
jgi:hypothetical protein